MSRRRAGLRRNSRRESIGPRGMCDGWKKNSEGGVLDGRRLTHPASDCLGIYLYVPAEMHGRNVIGMPSGTMIRHLGNIVVPSSSIVLRLFPCDWSPLHPQAVRCSHSRHELTLFYPRFFASLSLLPLVNKICDEVQGLSQQPSGS